MKYVASTVALALFLTACAGNDGSSDQSTTVPPPKSSTSTTTSTSTSTTEAIAPPTVGDPTTEAFATEGFPGSGAPALLQEVRTETYDDFVRLVYEFGATTPGYRIEYFDGPVRANPAGNEVDIAGNEFITISMAPAAGVDLSGDEPVVTYDGPERTTIESGSVTEMVKTEDFESHLTWVVGVDETLPFSFSTLEEPPRLVVDIHMDASS